MSKFITVQTVRPKWTDMEINEYKLDVKVSLNKEDIVSIEEDDTYPDICNVRDCNGDWWVVNTSREDFMQQLNEVEADTNKQAEPNIGDICWFWNKNGGTKEIASLRRRLDVNTWVDDRNGCSWQYCQKATDQEIKMHGFVPSGW